MNVPINLGRRNLFRGRPVDTPAPIRPPFTIAEDQFQRHCTACQDCVSACPEMIIIRGAGGLPELDFSHGECIFCKRCAQACKASVFDLKLPQPWSLQLTLNSDCLASKQVVCQSCNDACDQGAIQFHLRRASIAKPDIDQEKCTGCGACISSCPADALALQPSGPELTWNKTYA